MSRVGNDLDLHRAATDSILADFRAVMQERNEAIELAAKYKDALNQLGTVLMLAASEPGLDPELALAMRRAHSQALSVRGLLSTDPR